MVISSPPSSSEIFFPVPAVAIRNTFPISVEPVNATFLTFWCSASVCPMAPFPVITLKTPGGSPASAQISANNNADNWVADAGFKTTVFPMARAGATFQVRSISGKFHGTIAPTTPIEDQSVLIFSSNRSQKTRRKCS